MPASAIDTSILQIGSVATSGKGAKSAPIVLPGDKPVFRQPASPLIAMYEPSAYQNADATRINVVLRPTPEQEQELKELDDWILAYIAENSERLLGKTHTTSQLTERYQTILKTSDKYPTTIRAKMNTQGFSATKFWNVEGKTCPAPSIWSGCAVWPRIRVKGLRFMSRQFGVLLELTDARVEQAETSCPFDV